MKTALCLKHGSERVVSQGAVKFEKAAMKIKVKISAAFDRYVSVGENEPEYLCFDAPVPVKTVLRKLMIPDDLPKLILINGIVKNQEQLLHDGDTLSIFPTMSGG